MHYRKFDNEAAANKLVFNLRKGCWTQVSITHSPFTNTWYVFWS